MNISKILTGNSPQNNNVRYLLWSLRYKDHFGYYPKSHNHDLYECRICKRPVWIETHIKPDITDITCSKICFLELVELRNDNHWS